MEATEIEAGIAEGDSEVTPVVHEVGCPQRIWFNAPNHMAKWLRAFKGKFGLSWSQAVREVLRREMERTPIEELTK